MSNKTPLGVKPGHRGSVSKTKTPPVQSSPSPTAKPNAWGKPLSFPKATPATVDKAPVIEKVKVEPVDNGCSGEETLVWACKTMTGMNVSIETKDGKVHKGLLKNTQTMKNGKLNRVFAVHVMETGAVVQVPLNEFKQLTVERLDMTFAEEAADSFRTDSQISGMGWNERELTKWHGEEGVSLEDDGSLHGGKDWDQFAENHKRFGISANFNETLYTTPLNPHEFDRSDHSRAERLAREIMKGDTSNVHMREERGIQPGADYDEEELYGAVMRDQGDGRYVPPHLRNSAVNGTQPNTHNVQAAAPTQQTLTLTQASTGQENANEQASGARSGVEGKEDATVGSGENAESEGTLTTDIDIQQSQAPDTDTDTPTQPTDRQGSQGSTAEPTQPTTDTPQPSEEKAKTATPDTKATNAGGDLKTAPEGSEKGPEQSSNTATPSSASPSVMSDPAILSGNKSKLRPTAKAFNPSAKAFVPGGGSRTDSMPPAPAINGGMGGGMPMNAADYKQQQLLIQQILFQQAQQQLKQAQQMGFSPGQNFYPNGAGRGMVPYFAGPGGVPMPVPAGYQMPGSGSGGPTQMDYNAYLAAMAQQRMSPNMVPMPFDPSGTPSPRGGSPLPHNAHAQPQQQQPIQQQQQQGQLDAMAIHAHAQGQAHAFAQAQAHAQAQAQLMRQHGGRVGPFSPHGHPQGLPSNMHQQHQTLGQNQPQHPGQGQGHNRPKSSHSHHSGGRRSNASSNAASPSPQPPQHSGKKWNNNKTPRAPVVSQEAQN